MKGLSLYNDSFFKLVGQIENDLSAFYGFPQLGVGSFFFDQDVPLSREFGLSLNARGGVYIIPGDVETHIGIHIDASLFPQMALQDPLKRLSIANLDAFWVVVEEISHFYLIANSARLGRGVSLLELEWQGEIDKILIAAVTLYRQCGDAHYLHLTRCLFEECQIIESLDGAALYSEASKFAARFWYDLISYHSGISNPLGSSTLKKALQASYELPWVKKIEFIKNLSRSPGKIKAA